MKLLKTIPLIFLCIFFLALTATAGEAMPEGHQAMAEEAPPGKHIKTNTVDGHTMAYYLLDRSTETADSAHAMPGMASHGAKDKKPDHLMVVITGADGKRVEGAKVGYLVTTAKGATQKAMAMAMGSSYGADVTLQAGQTFTIKSKFIIGNGTFVDEFTYVAK